MGRHRLHARGPPRRCARGGTCLPPRRPRGRPVRPAAQSIPAFPTRPASLLPGRNASSPPGPTCPCSSHSIHPCCKDKFFKEKSCPKSAESLNLNNIHQKGLMKLTALLCALCCCVGWACAQEPQGHFAGAIQTPQGELPIIFHFGQPSGAPHVTMDSPSQGISGFPVQKTHYSSDGQFNIGMPSCRNPSRQTPSAPEACPDAQRCSAACVTAVPRQPAVPPAAHRKAAGNRRPSCPQILAAKRPATARNYKFWRLKPRNLQILDTKNGRACKFWRSGTDAMPERESGRGRPCGRDVVRFFPARRDFLAAARAFC